MHATHRVALGVLLALSTSACGSTSRGGSTPTPQTEMEQYFVGTQVFRLPDGSEQAGGSVALRRTLRPEEHTVTEEVVIRDTAGSVEARSMRFNVDATDAHFVVQPVEGEALEGEGDFTGEPWNWTAWHIQTRRADGSVIVIDETLTATDLSAESRVTGADGNAALVIRQVLTRVSRERYEEERDALAPGASGP
jgi:hypothetical protein